MLEEFRISEETPDFSIGTNYSRETIRSPWIKGHDSCIFKGNLWFSYHPKEIFARAGVTCTDMRRAEDLANLFDGDLSGFYYIAAASSEGSEEAQKWVLGGLATYLNEHGLSFHDRHQVLPADHLKAFCDYLEGKRFERNFAKDIFAELLAAERFEMVETGSWDILVYQADPGLVTNISDFTWETFEEAIDYGATWKAVPRKTCVRRFAASEILDRIIDNPRYKAVDDGEIDTIIDQVLAAHPAEVAKALANPRAVNWFMGQIIKASKGKAAPIVVQEKLKLRFPG